MGSGVIVAAARLDTLGVRLKVQDGMLLWGARPGTLSAQERAEVKDLLREHRGELLADLASGSRSVPVDSAVDEAELAADAPAPLTVSHERAATSTRVREQTAMSSRNGVSPQTVEETNEDDEKGRALLTPNEAERLKAEIIAVVTVESAKFDRSLYDRLMVRWLAHEVAEAQVAPRAAAPSL